jgi:hypothetical protein
MEHDSETTLPFVTIGLAARYAMHDLARWRALRSDMICDDLAVVEFIESATRQYRACRCEGHKLAILVGALALVKGSGK